MNDIFITENFLLQSDTAAALYHQYARDLPIIDYHCHLPPRQIAEDHRFENLTQIWLYGDHYKWRLMRANGIDERYITGEATDLEKFQKWAQTVPKTLRNCMYHWVHLELNRPFGISDRLLNPATAEGIWQDCNAKLAQTGFSARGIMKRMNVVLACTTDDPADSLEHHRAIAEDRSFDIRILPTFRPGAGMAVESPEAFNTWLDKLTAAAEVDIRDFDTYLDAIRRRHQFFHDMGCRLSDHGIETVYAANYRQDEIRKIFNKVRGGGLPDAEEIVKFKSAMLYELAVMDHQAGWTQQIHYGALRNNNTWMFERLGPDSGYDSIGECQIARPLAGLLDRLDRSGQLPRTILYNLNPRDNELIASMIGNFQDARTPGKMQFGPAWWYLDQIDGMTRQIEALSNAGLLSRFVGMTTDSRSFLSYTRHEYFRRLLCNILGGEMDAGLLPDDMELIGNLVADICYHNAAAYFGFDLPK